MSIAIVNCSGNVGKTTVTRELLAPRLSHMSVRQVESINTDDSAGPKVEVMIAARFDELHEELMRGRNLLVDIGASNVEEYLNRLDASEGAQEDYACFIVPVEPESKQMKDTMKTINLLEDRGVEPNRIRVLLNKVELVKSEAREVTLRRHFGQLFDLHEQDASFLLNHDALVPKNDVFTLAAAAGRTIHDIATDGVDYKAQLAGAATDAEKDRLVKLVALKRKALSIEPMLDSAFHALLAGVDA
ncbi:StbB family protein [Burkholderia cenocepacia]|uniref:StbB family protein n=1 Tax=Burkholderia cenocepacia TaxID=95486 RepID=UPI002B245A37|nr:StbB family protein [Burkholderia cenocepacia]MEB2558795.1 StbB family protein [Burkholderia cenocepacia]